MIRRIGNSIIICKDTPPSGALYFSCFAVFVLFVIAVVWLIGIFTEYYTMDRSFVTGVTILSLIAALLGWRLATLIKSMIDVMRGKPQIRIDSDGIAILGDKLRRWTEIKQIRLVKDFDAKYIALESFSEDDNMNYMLYSPFETREFKHLEELKSILNQFTDKVQISE